MVCIETLGENIDLCWRFENLISNSFLWSASCCLMYFFSFIILLHAFHIFNSRYFYFKKVFPPSWERGFVLMQRLICQCNEPIYMTSYKVLPSYNELLCIKNLYFLTLSLSTYIAVISSFNADFESKANRVRMCSER